MTSRDEAAEALTVARDAWQTWRCAWDELVARLHHASVSTARLDAYRVGTGYDEGGGQSLEGWLDEIERQIEEA
jgi:hypothetical protein